MFPSGVGIDEFTHELDRLEKVSRFAEMPRNLFDEGPHLVSTSDLPWGDAVREQSVTAYLRFIHGETWITGGGAREMETGIVGWLGGLFGASAPAGFITAGGSESNMCAILTAKQRSGRKGGSVVFPDNGHYSLYKLCKMFDLDAIPVPAPPGRLDQVDPAAIEAAIRPDTIAIIATAGTWAYGSVDPIAEIGEIAQRYNLYLHVDAAFGGYILPFLERSGYDPAIPPWDFRVPAVCSISADLHKNGMAPPPAGTLVFRDESLLRSAKEICPPNGTMSGTRGAGPIAGAWAMVKLLGEAGYTAVSRASMGLRDRLADGVRQIDGLSVYPGSRINMVLIHSETMDLRPVADALRAQGWMFAARAVPSPVGIVVVPMPHNDGQVEPFLADLRDTVALATPLEAELDPASLEKVSSYGF
ncbi:aminotransferase class V-fold PLP-dependent enzyme [Amycolatopsis jejuensis]|uniref:aminotransferase class V-fold PLP-dependent enzyme n=1 Tax=Amycolatopsis jejuensis TaxID=330084 RepID=UPI00052792EF|nr:aminotransferase class V-fold PLP-dependent enzyme [Amycolatopsis jejuensis]